MGTWLAFALTLMNMISNRGSRVLITLYALKLGAEPLTVGLLAATYAIFPVMFSWHSGRMSDRYGPRAPMTLAAVAGALSLSLPYFVPTLGILFVASFLHGTSSTYYNVSTQNLIGMLSDVRNRGRNFGNYSMVVSVGNAIGPVFAGFSIDYFGYQATFLYMAAVLFVPVILLMVWGDALPGKVTDAAPAHSVGHMLRNPLLWPVLLASAIAQAGLELFQVYMPVYGNQHGMSASAIGVVLSMLAVGAVAGRALVTQWVARSSEEKVLAYAQFVASLCFAIVPFFQGITALSIIALVFGFGLNCSQPVSLTLIYSRSPEGRAGEALGLRFTMDSVARLLGPAAFGMIASVLGVGAVFWLSALMMGAGGANSHRDATKVGK